MPSLTWDKRFLDLAQMVASWSKDPKKQVGCVLVDELNRIVSTGYNGPPRGVDNYTPEERLPLTIHAEINAILFAERNFVTAYVWPVLPCSQCMAALAQAGVQRIVSKAEPSAKWCPHITYKLCNDLNIELVIL